MQAYKGSHGHTVSRSRGQRSVKSAIRQSPSVPAHMAADRAQKCCIRHVLQGRSRKPGRRCRDACPVPLAWATRRRTPGSFVRCLNRAGKYSMNPEVICPAMRMAKTTFRVGGWLSSVGLSGAKWRDVGLAEDVHLLCTMLVGQVARNSFSKSCGRCMARHDREGLHPDASLRRRTSASTRLTNVRRCAVGRFLL